MSCRVNTYTYLTPISARRSRAHHSASLTPRPRTGRSDVEPTPIPATLTQIPLTLTREDEGREARSPSAPTSNTSCETEGREARCRTPRSKSLARTGRSNPQLKLSETEGREA
jgi:hypothetical protein